MEAGDTLGCLPTFMYGMYNYLVYLVSRRASLGTSGGRLGITTSVPFISSAARKEAKQASKLHQRM